MDAFSLTGRMEKQHNDKTELLEEKFSDDEMIDLEDNDDDDSPTANKFFDHDMLVSDNNNVKEKTTDIFPNFPESDDDLEDDEIAERRMDTKGVVDQSAQHPQQQQQQQQQQGPSVQSIFPQPYEVPNGLSVMS